LMKVAYILEGMREGWLTYELDALKDIGVEIDINPSNPAAYGDFSDYVKPEKRSFPRDIIGLLKKLSGSASGGSSNALALFKRLRGYAGWRIAIATIAMVDSIKGGGAGIIHAHFATGPAASAMAVSALTGIPFSFTGHGYDLYREPIDWEFHAKKCRRAAFVRCISEFNRKHLLKKTGVDGRNFHVVPCGVDTSRFSPGRDESDVPEGKGIVLAVAGLVPPKGLPYLIEAFSDPGVKRLGRRLVIAGDGPMMGELVDQARRLRVDAEFLGDVPNREIDAYYRRAEVFVLPCITAPDGHHDGIPVVMMEAMASGVPVISSKISGIPELVEDGVNGILLPEKDAKAVADAIKLLLTDRDMRRRFSAEARRKVVKEFEIRDVAERIKELFIKYSKVER
jgi:colanic acid/amylovoran biosynthesis glycosyltransferase